MNRAYLTMFKTRFVECLMPDQPSEQMAQHYVVKALKNHLVLHSDVWFDTAYRRARRLQYKVAEFPRTVCARNEQPRFPSPDRVRNSSSAEGWLCLTDE